MARKSKLDWYIASVDILNNQGSKALTIDALTKSLGVTKGSFYHHFGSLQQFKTDLLIHFEEAGTLQIITQTEQEATPAAKLHRLIEIVSEHVAHTPSYLEMGLRNWAQQEEAVQQFLTKVDAQRIAYVKNLLAEHSMDAQKAQRAAEIFYTILIGSEHTFPPLAPTNLKAYLTELLTLYGVHHE